MATELKPVYLLSGGDRPKIARAVDRLRARFDAAAVEILDAVEAAGADAVAACNALGLFGGGGRLVLVTGVERWKADDAKALAEYLKAPTPETVLALVGEELRKDSPLAKACAKAGEVLVYDVQRRDLPRWTAEQFQRAGASATPTACRALIELVGESPDELALEIDKLATWAGGEEVDEHAVEAFVAPRAEAPPWALTDAWGRRDVGAVLAATERALGRGATASALVWRVGDHLELVRACRGLAAEGVQPGEAAKRLRKKEYPVRKAYDQAEAFGGEELDAAIVRLASADEAVKGGSRLPDQLVLERALVDVTRRVETGRGPG